MTSADRLKVDALWPRISARAEAELLPQSREGWSYRQVSCPALPNHLFLRFTREDGAGNASRFTASISRDGKDTVRIVPLLRHGYSLFSPPAVNAGTIAVFNRIREEEQQPQQDWLGISLCYAALTGAEPWMGASSPLETGPRIEILRQGGALVGFTDRATGANWQLSFDDQGRLQKVTRTSAGRHMQPRPVGSENALRNPRTPPVAPVSMHEAGSTTAGHGSRMDQILPF